MPDGLNTSPAVSNHPAIIIRASKGWAWVNFRELWEYRDLLYFLIWRDVKVRYKQTALVPHPVSWTQVIFKPPSRLSFGRAIGPWPARG